MSSVTKYRGVTVVDGTGDDRYVADVTVHGERIVHIGASTGANEQGLVLAPGFVDMHAHSDLAVLRGAEHGVKALQGVTCEVLGQDGLGYAPLDDHTARAIPAQIAGWNGPAPVITWRSMADFLRILEERALTNIAMLVPQGNLRMMVIGHANRPASRAEIIAMSELLALSLDAGAVGMSSGLTYTPGMYADTAELEALCRTVAEHGGFWAPHTRSYGGRALEAYREVLEIGRQTGCPIHLTHATMNFPPNKGRARELLALVDEALAAGVDVTMDTYPYLPGATTLTALLPSSLATSGDVVAAVAGLSKAGREEVRAELEERGSDGFHGERADWRAIEISGVGRAALAHLVGQTVAEIAAREGRGAVDVVLDTVIADEGATGILMHVGDEENVREIMRHPRHSGGSDGILIGGKPHPRGFGTFPRYLGHYVRDEGVLSLEEAIRHLSAVPAARLGIDRGDSPRGIVAEGAIADLVLFDPEQISSPATFAEPRTAPVGIREVLVGGVAVVRDGVLTGRTPGRALRGESVVV